MCQMIVILTSIIFMIVTSEFREKGEIYDPATVVTLLPGKEPVIPGRG